MSTKTVSNRNDPVIEHRDQLVAPMAAGEKPAERWRIGTEHEKFVYCRKDRHAPSYEEPGGIRDLLDSLTEYGWEPIEEGGKVIALKG
ncbi:MAG: glutamate--cysteine ligase, partial [Sphingorhabdus sp.]